MNRSLFVVWVSISLIGVSLFNYLFDGLRYTKYLIIFLPLFFLNWNIKVHWRNRPYLWPFLFLTFYAVFGLLRSNQYGVDDLIFLTSAFCIFLFIEDVEINLKRVFVCFALCFFVYGLTNYKNVQFSIVGSSSPFESIFSFVFGLFFVYFFHRKNKPFYFLALLLTVVAMKRIAIMGCLFVVLVNYMPVLKEYIYKSKFIGVFANGVVLVLLVLLGTGLLNEIIKRFTGLDVTFLTMGRNIIFEGASYRYLNNFNTFLFGSGAGSSYLLAAANIDEIKVNLHSDVFKIAIEFGSIFFILFFALLYKPSNRLCVSLALYLNILFLTDNVISYTVVMIFYFLICYVACLEKCQVSNESIFRKGQVL